MAEHEVDREETLTHAIVSGIACFALIGVLIWLIMSLGESQ